MIGIIDYGVGNIASFLNIYKQLNIPVRVVKKVDELEGVSKIILPGVGHFDYAMEKFSNSGMKDAVNRMVIEEKKPVIGICVGMQMMAKQSDEGELQGLGWIDADVKRFGEGMNYNNTVLPLPHMGWNDIQNQQSALFDKLTDEVRFYFLHSYYFKCAKEEQVIAQANYGIDFTVAVNQENIYGVQFHPEKSHHYGVKLLKNFAEKC